MSYIYTKSQRSLRRSPKTKPVYSRLTASASAGPALPDCPRADTLLEIFHPMLGRRVTHEVHGEINGLLMVAERRPRYPDIPRYISNMTMRRPAVLWAIKLMAGVPHLRPPISETIMPLPLTHAVHTNWNPDFRHMFFRMFGGSWLLSPRPGDNLMALATCGRNLLPVSIWRCSW